MFAVLAAAIALAAPAGFVENPTLDARAAWITGKPVTVYCASTDAAWSSFVSSSGDTMVDPNGVTLAAGDSATYLSPATCGPLLARLRRRSYALHALGASLLTLTHEAIHMSGVADEGQTECAAITKLPSFLVAKWGFRKGSPAFFQVLYGARASHDGLPRQYRTQC